MIHGLVVFSLLVYKVYKYIYMQIYALCINVNSLFHSFKMPPVTKDNFEKLICSSLTLMKGKAFYSVLRIFVVSCFLFNLFFFLRKRTAYCVLLRSIKWHFASSITLYDLSVTQPFFDRNSLSDRVKIY